ncbi:MAG: transcriptional regulator [Anaerolineae bacterium]|jgi:hypothetical protein
METGKDRTQRHFEAARRKAFWNEIGRLLNGRSNRLLSWRDVQDKLHLSDFIDREVVSVPLERIVGSVGRYREFDRAFMPKLDSTAPRWRSIARGTLDDVSLPPVTLYKVGEIYFVIDGHHRVSVARELGRAFVDAKVIEAEPRVPVTTSLDADSLEVAGEYTGFLESTRLDVLRPQQIVRFTTIGAYDWALEHIALHRDAMSREQHRVVTQDEAVEDWYDGVYLPIVRIIRERDMLDEFPGRTEADLFLWIVDHQHDLSERCGPGVSEERAAEHLAYRYTVRPIKRLARAAREWVAGPVCGPLVDGASDGSGAWKRDGGFSPGKGRR